MVILPTRTRAVAAKGSRRPPMPKKLVHLSLPIVALATVSCAMPSEYQPPPDLAPDATATLTGSKVANPIPTFADQRTDVVDIDGKATMSRIYDWDTVYRLAPGQHTVRMRFSEGTFDGIFDSRIDVEAGKSYVARCRKPSFMSVQCWIEDQAAGTPVTDKQASRVHVQPMPMIIVPVR